MNTESIIQMPFPRWKSFQLILVTGEIVGAEPIKLLKPPTKNKRFEGLL